MKTLKQIIQGAVVLAVALLVLTVVFVVVAPIVYLYAVRVLFVTCVRGGI
jgi:hypothetical protein